ncbi:hypothetical protein [Hasllibacter sp. MH4015]|uniref:hypothetical protein n=1 Tax=Hasllibacter sp. MH4015 TaxID=2854029 RepID=UPI001CD5B3F7|nr:hypothetical protein [Hasllibacter sp. MH4015]
MRRARIGLFAAIYTICAVFFAVAFFDRYWRHRDCFNDLGRCFVSAEDGVYTTSAFVWAPMAILCALLAIFALWRFFRARRIAG